MTLREDVLSVMRDGSRIDRYLELCDGEMYLTTRNTAERQYRVPPSLDASEEDDEESVDLLLDDAMMKLSDGKHENLTWHQCPVDAGQTVDITYAVDWESETLYRRTHDRSDGEVTVEAARITGGEFAPWNGVLPTAGEWRAE